MNTSLAPQPEDTLFHLQGVCYLYNGRHLALDGIDLDIARGEQIDLLGANGSGKSTLLKLLNGIIGPTEGIMMALGARPKRSQRDSVLSLHSRRDPAR